jgi:hypothetical protein
MVMQILCPCAMHDVVGTLHLRRAAMGDQQILASFQMLLILEDVLGGNVPARQAPQYSPPGGPSHCSLNTSEEFQQRRGYWSGHQQSPKTRNPDGGRNRQQFRQPAGQGAGASALLGNIFNHNIALDVPLMLGVLPNDRDLLDGETALIQLSHGFFRLRQMIVYTDHALFRHFLLPS